MKTISLNYKDMVLQNPFIGFAHHKIITNKSGQAVDYEYIEVNQQFEKFTGLKENQVVGKRITEIIPGFENEEFNWIAFYGKVAISGKSAEIVQYAALLKKWYSVLALCPEKGYFITLFYDITNIKQKENELKLMNEEYAVLNQAYVTQNEVLNTLLEESHDKTKLIENALQSGSKYQKELHRKDIVQNSILNSTANGLLVVNEQGEVLFSNKRFFDMWKIPDNIRSEKNDAQLMRFILDQLLDPESFTSTVNHLYQTDEISMDILLFKDHRVFERYSEPLIESNEIIGRTWSFNDITDREIQKSKLKKINVILNGIRDINKLQTLETDAQGLIDGICNNLVNVFGFGAAMILLLNDNRFNIGAHVGFGEQFVKLKAHLENGKHVPCYKKSALLNDAVFVDKPEVLCVNCIESNHRCNFVIPIEHNKIILGYFHVDLTKDLISDIEFKSLLKEIGAEIALALVKIELEEKQKNYIKEIKLKENKLNSILQSSPIGIGYSKNRIFYTVNDKFSEITGYPKTELIGEKSRLLYAFDAEYKEVGKALRKLENDFKSRSIEVRWKRKDGKIIDILLSFANVNPLNANEGYSVAIEDITDKKKDKLLKDVLLNIAKASNKTEDIEQIAPIIRRELSHLFNTENFYIALYNSESNRYSFPYYVDQIEEKFKNSKQQFDLSGSRTDQVRRMKNAALIDFEQEEELIRRGELSQGYEKSSVWMAAPLIDVKGSAFGVIAVQHYEIRDAYCHEDLQILDHIAKNLSQIFEKKKAQKELKDSEERFRILIETQGEGVAHVDLLENIQFINPAGAEIFGMDINELIGRNLSEFLDEDQSNFVKEQTLKRIKGEKSNYELRIQNKKGSERTILLTATPIYNNSKVIGNLGIFRDISDRKKAELLLQQKNKELQDAEDDLRTSNEELNAVNNELERSYNELLIAKEKAESADRLKTAFLANMSHEIRTPMNSILGFSELLKNNKLSEEKQKHFINIININGIQLISIIDDIIDFSKIEANQLEIRRSRVDLVQLFEEKFYAYKKRIKRDHLDIKLNLVIPLVKEVFVYTDIARLKQVISNLLANALKFTEIGQVDFGFKTEKDELLFFVKDTGIGIAEDKQELIFERFRQGDDSRSRKYGGTGLGLTISKRLIGLLGGRMWVESKLDEGSQFYFTIPFE